MMCCNLNISSLAVEIDAKTIVDVLGNSSYVNNKFLLFWMIAGCWLSVFGKFRLSTTTVRQTNVLIALLG